MEAQATLTPGWTQCGTCEWQIDGNGLLTIRPLGNGSSGTLADWTDRYSTGYSPWYNDRTITKVVINPGVHAVTCDEMFSLCENITSIDLSGLDTTNVTSMNSMFYGCQSLLSVDVSGLYTKSLVNMGKMFSSCYSLTSINLDGFDTSKVQCMSGAFLGCWSLTSLNVSSFDTSNVSEMMMLFNGCKSLTSLDVSNFDISQVTDLEYMFTDCQKLTSLNLADFNTANVTSMEGMFYNCMSLKTILVSSDFSTAQVTSSNDMFNSCTSLVGGKGTTFSSASIDIARAHVDGGASNPGYFTLGHKKSFGDVNNNGTVNIVDAQLAYDIAANNMYRYYSDYDEMCERAKVTGGAKPCAEDARAIQYYAATGTWGI